MIKSDAKLKKLSEVFRKDNQRLISEAIDLLRDEQPFIGAIALLAELYNRTSNDEIKSSIEDFMNDIKDQSAAPEVISQITYGWKQDTTRMLVASCWQSGLDYSVYSMEITSVFMSADYATAVECLTVIEESVHALTTKQKQELLTYIDNKIQLLKPGMTDLALELKSILETV
jgi:predicted DNA-binding protein